MNKYFIGLPNYQRFVMVCVVFIAVCLLGSLIQSSSASAYTSDYQGAKDFGDNFCTTYAGVGIGDYLWVTAQDGTRSLSLAAGTKTVSVRVHGGGKYCSSFTAAGSTFTGAISGTQVFSGSVNYPANKSAGSYFGGSGNSADPYTDVLMDVRNLLPGEHTVCITLKTFSTPKLPLKDSPSSCTTMTLYIVWDKQGQSYATTVPKSNPRPSDAQVNKQDNIVTGAAAATGTPGQAIYWKHVIFNKSGVTIPGGTIGYKVEGFGSDNSTESKVAGNIPATRNFTTRNYFNARLGAFVPATYNITQNEVGTKLCQFISSWPYFPDGNGITWRRSQQACVNVPYNFKLTPTIANVPTTSEAEAEIRVDYDITNSGPTKSYTNTDWQMVKFTLPADATPSLGGTGTQSPCAFYGAGCSPVKTGSGVLFSPDGSAGSVVSVAGYVDKINVGNLATDRQLCFATAVTKYQSGATGSNEWKYGAVRCVKISKKPKVQVWGSDVRVGGKIASGLSTVGGRTYGSWGEYGVFSTLPNSKFASASALATGNPNGAQGGWSEFTFSNQPTFGSYGILPASTLANQFTGLSAAGMGTSMSAGDSTYNGVYRPSGDLEIDGGTINAGRSVIINATGRNVTIKNSITYQNGSYASPSTVPQLVIIANNIYIQQGATNVDAWLIASGAIDTCSDVGTRGVMPPNGGTLSTTTCDKALTVHGPVSANKLVLKRTAGADSSTRTDPAETLNMRSDAYLWSYQRALKSGQIHTVFSKELPARF